MMPLVLTTARPLRDSDNLPAVTTLRLWGQATIPPGTELPAVTSLELWDQATIPPGTELPAVTTLRLGGQATIPPGTELPAVTTLELWGQATIPPGTELPAVTSLELWDQATIPPGTELPAVLLEQVPLVENLHRKVWESIQSDPETRLEMSVWHTCESTHCRAGWAVTLAGKAGRDYEAQVGVRTAGALIYLKSTGMIPDFFCDNQTALADIKRCAGVQQ